MQRGVYFDGWYPRQHNYHPSLPARRLRMIDDLADMRATVLVWSALGGGSVALPYLEEEAFGEIPARFRLYGFVNDSEFIGACAARGIEVLGIVFECQGWEFPVEYGPGGEILALNELRGAGRRGWAGLREFTHDTGPRSWKPFGHYFPGGLRNSLGEPVTDLWAECASRDLEGNPLHATWVEAPDREHQAYCMDRNNPVWREYLKAVIRIQVDAGVAGVQLDESETPMGAMRYGGCFSQGKDVLVVENPYGGVIPQLVSDLNQGKSYDLFRLSVYEGAAMGTCMTLPYGSWLGSEIEDSYWAPKILTDEAGQFLESIDGLRSRVSANEVAVLYSVAANLRAEIDGGKWDDQGASFTPAAGAVPPTGYWDAIERLSGDCIPFDCVVLPDERYRDNDVTGPSLARYRTIVAAGCRHVSEAQHRAVRAYLDGGGTAVIVGDYGLNLPATIRQQVTAHDRTRITGLSSLTSQVSDRQVLCAGAGTLAVNLDAISPSESALHIVNYAFSRAEDACTPRRFLDIAVRTAHPVGAATFYAPGRSQEPIAVTRDGSRMRLLIPRLDVYAVIRLAAA